MNGSSTPPPVGGEEPLPPEHSLPSYNEPTPETHRRISREEEAELALLRTEFAPGTPWLITVLFLLTIASLPVINLAARLRTEAHRNATPGADILGLLPSTAKLKQAKTWNDWVGLLPSAAAIKSAEKSLEKESIVSQYLLPRVQSVLTGTLKAGNEQVYPGVDGWLFYRPDVDYVIGPPFLDPARLKQRERDLGIQPDPVKAIVDFKEQLAARGIELIVVPVPAKPGIETHALSGTLPTGEPVQNAAYATFREKLSAAGVSILDMESVYKSRRPQTETAGVTSAYLQTDTHWVPESMQLVARQIAHRIEPGNSLAGDRYKLVPKEVRALGDIALMLKLPPEQTIYAPQAVTIQQVQAGNTVWKPDSNSDVLLLGDSFSNIYSLAPMGWGESAGLAEHISYHLARPIDCILRNSDGAFATREQLSRELARGRDRLKGKKVVVWEFAQRELMFGNWKALSLALGEPKPAKFYQEPPEEGVIVTAQVVATTSYPRPGTVPYRDHIFSVLLEEIDGVRATGNVQAVAYFQSMRDNVWTSATRLRSGDRVKLRLTPWPGAHREREGFERSTFDDEALQLEEPVWAELVE